MDGTDIKRKADKGKGIVYRYDRDFMLKMRNSKLSKVWPSNLDKNFVGADGLWDPVRSMESSSSGATDRNNERFERGGRNDERELKRRSTSSTNERTRGMASSNANNSGGGTGSGAVDDRDSIILGPQKRSWGSGCHMPSTGGSGNVGVGGGGGTGGGSGGSVGNNSGPRGGGSRGGGGGSGGGGSGGISGGSSRATALRNSSRFNEHDDRDTHSYDHRHDRHDRHDRHERDFRSGKGRTSFGTGGRHSDHREFERNRKSGMSRQDDGNFGSKEEPEWFSGGPLTQFETIELHGMSDEEEGGGTKSRRRRGNSDRMNYSDRRKSAPVERKTTQGRSTHEANKTANRTHQEATADPQPFVGDKRNDPKPTTDVSTEALSTKQESAIETTQPEAIQSQPVMVEVPSETVGLDDLNFDLPGLLEEDSTPVVMSSGSRFSHLFQNGVNGDPDPTSGQDSSPMDDSEGIEVLSVSKENVQPSAPGFGRLDVNDGLGFGLADDDPAIASSAAVMNSMFTTQAMSQMSEDRSQVKPKQQFRGNTFKGSGHESSVSRLFRGQTSATGRQNDYTSSDSRNIAPNPTAKEMEDAIKGMLFKKGPNRVQFNHNQYSGLDGSVGIQSINKLNIPTADLGQVKTVEELEGSMGTSSEPKPKTNTVVGASAGAGAGDMSAYQKLLKLVASNQATVSGSMPNKSSVAAFSTPLCSSSDIANTNNNSVGSKSSSTSSSTNNIPEAPWNGSSEQQGSNRSVLNNQISQLLTVQQQQKLQLLKKQQQQQQQQQLLNFLRMSGISASNIGSGVTQNQVSSNLCNNLLGTPGVAGSSISSQSNNPNALANALAASRNYHPMMHQKVNPQSNAVSATARMMQQQQQLPSQGMSQQPAQPQQQAQQMPGLTLQHLLKQQQQQQHSILSGSSSASASNQANVNDLIGKSSIAGGSDKNASTNADLSALLAHQLNIQSMQTSGAPRPIVKRSGGVPVSSGGTLSPRPIVGSSNNAVTASSTSAGSMTSGQQAGSAIGLQGNNSNSSGVNSNLPSLSALGAIPRTANQSMFMLQQQQQQQQQIMQRHLVAFAAQQSFNRNPMAALQQQQQQRQILAQYVQQQQQSQTSTTSTSRQNSQGSNANTNDLSRFFSQEILASGQRMGGGSSRGLPEERMMTVDEVERVSASQH